MKNLFFMILATVVVLSCSSCNFSENKIKIVGNMPDSISSKFWDANDNEQLFIAQMGYLDAISMYCRQTLFFTYGNEGDMMRHTMDNQRAEKVYDILKAAADYGNAECQFMLACVLTENQCTRFYDSDYKEYQEPDNPDYIYRDLTEAKKYYKMFLENPSEEKSPFGLKEKDILIMIGRVFPELVNAHR